MTSSIGQSIEILCNEQGLDRDMVIEAMKDAVKAAARKQFRAHDKTGESIQVDWNNEEGIIEISVQKTVVEEVENPSAELSLTEAVELAGDAVEVGDILLIPLPAEEMGRIAAQTAKQILVQKVREAIREKVYEEYIDRKGELINGTVKRFERGDIIIDLGDNLEAILPRKEQARGEIWNQGERIRVVILDVSKEQKGQQITVSRASAELIKRLFEMEVPEIYDDTVVIKSAVREPGDRAKIAVASNEKDVDPVGACVGMKGSWVQSIIKELRGEKIDIIEWSDEPSVFAANALSPAKVSQVRITDINNRQMEVIVGEDQLSLAIGKKGQNVRLATRLVGWNVKIVSEELLKQEIAQQMGEMMASGEAVPLTALQGVSATQAEALAEKGVSDVEALAAMSLDDLVETLDLSLDEGQLILDSANSIVAAKNARAETADDEGVSDELTEDVPAAGDDGITAEAGDEAAAAGDPVSGQVDASAAENEDPAGEVEGDISSNQFEEEAPAVSDQELKQETADSESRSMESEEVDTSDIPEPSENENVGEQVPAGSEDADEEEKE